MRKEDLMLGNWVEVTRTECVADGGHYITWSEYGKVIGITDSYIEVEVRDGEYNVDAHEDELKPIPLTPEILKKNFNSKELPDDPYGAYFFGGNDYIEVYIKEYTDGLWQVSVDEVEMGGLPSWRMFVSNVHELQHALRLCGIDKEIKI